MGMFSLCNLKTRKHSVLPDSMIDVLIRFSKVFSLFGDI